MTWSAGHSSSGSCVDEPGYAVVQPGRCSAAAPTKALLYVVLQLRGRAWDDAGVRCPITVETADQARQHEDAAEGLCERERVPDLGELVMDQREVLRHAHATVERDRAVGSDLVLDASESTRLAEAGARSPLGI